MLHLSVAQKISNTIVNIYGSSVTSSLTLFCHSFGKFWCSDNWGQDAEVWLSFLRKTGRETASRAGERFSELSVGAVSCPLGAV